MTNWQISTRRHFLSSTSILIAALAGRRIALGGDSYAERELAKHPAAYWRLGERQGPEAVDSSGNSHPGTYHGRALFGEKGAVQGDPAATRRVVVPGKERKT
jgi:hypothetical protein